jgi:hypothetical protein
LAAGHAIPVESGTDDRVPGRPAADAALKPVLALMFVNLGLSVLTAVISLVLHDSLLNYELAHTLVAAHLTPRDLAETRHVTQTALWIRLAATLLVSWLSIWRAYALRNGSRGAYLRLYYICVGGLVGIGYLLFTGQYPIWMRVEQGLQAVVLVALLVTVSRSPLRRRFRKRAWSGQPPRRRRE